MTTDPKLPVPRRWSTLSGPVLGLIGVLALFLALFAVRGGLKLFVSTSNIKVLVHGDTITAVAALGVLLVIVSGGIDLSTGSVVALVTVVTMLVYRALVARTGSMALATALAVPAGIAAGGLCGFTNGTLITRLRVTPFVVTLGMLSARAVWPCGWRAATRSTSRSERAPAGWTPWPGSIPITPTSTPVCG